MLYTEGNLTVEDAAMRRIARSKVRAALCSCETKTRDASGFARRQLGLIGELEIDR